MNIGKYLQLLYENKKKKEKQKKNRQHKKKYWAPTKKFQLMKPT